MVVAVEGHEREAAIREVVILAATAAVALVRVILSTLLCR